MHHISMKCSDPELVKRAVSFYEEFFGFSVLKRWDRGIYLTDGKEGIEIFTDGEGSFEKGSIRHFAIEVTDVDQIVLRLKEKGREVTLGPKDITVPFHARIAFCKGVLGEEIEIIQLKEKAL